MLKKRLIPCLIVKGNLLVQSFEFKRYLPIGKARIAIEYFVRWDVDEIILLDIEASKTRSKPQLDLIRDYAKACFVPFTVGGGITTESEIREVLKAGADKVSINSEAIRNPKFIHEAAEHFGSQSIVVSIDAKLNEKGEYRVFSHSQGACTDIEPTDWARHMEALGAGEILLTSVDRDGTRRGYDLPLIHSVAEALSIPVVACGGVGRVEHLVDGIVQGEASAVAAANIFQHTEHSTIVAKAYLKQSGVAVRLSSAAKYEGVVFDPLGRIRKEGASVPFPANVNEIF